MVGAGVESTRMAFYWSSAQPYRDTKELALNVDPTHLVDFPPDGKGVPTFYKHTDEVVAATASRGLALLPLIQDTPAWAAYDREKPIAHPRNPADYANYLTDLVNRYGPNGTFWLLHPEIEKHPIREWQIWNEVNLKYYWARHVWPGQYTKLLRAAHDAIKKADPHAKVILSALVNDSWRALPLIYKAHARGLFDAVAIHPYTANPKNVITVAKRIRAVMRHYHDRSKPIMFTELSWPSAIDNHGHHKTRRHYTIDVTERQEAQRIQAVYPLLARARRSLGIARVYWYTWATTDKGKGDPFDYAGLRVLRGSGDSRPKPAFSVWRRIVLGLEGCRGTKPNVTSC
jgi:hypothetical protein